MFNFLKKMFGKDGVAATTAEPRITSGAVAQVPKVVDKPVGAGVEVASLSLRSILEKLPPDLKPIVNQLPEPEVKIMLPVNTILKQLATGAVRMSLASLIRQAPPGTFRKTQIEDKQMVDVPLSEIFKSVDAKRLGRRNDQRRYDVPEEVTGLFGKDGASRSVNGAAAATNAGPKGESTGTPGIPVKEPAPAVSAQRVVRMPGISPVAPTISENGNSKPGVPAKAVPTAPKAQPAAATGKTGQLVLSFVELASGWPEGIRAELSSLPGDTKLIIPAEAVGAGLQKGKVVFQWAQVCRWLKPPLSGKVSIADDFEFVFPLKIIAPAFVAATGAAKRLEGVEIDHSLPDFFGPSSGQRPKPQAAVPVPAPVPAPTLVAEPAPEPIPVPAAESTPSPAVEATPPLTLSLVREEPTPVESPATATAGDFVQPAENVSVPPAEIVARACELPGVSGAVVGLEEGLVVAQKLPAGFAADTFAAFMPQIFGRLERYAAEMQLGEATQITIQSAQGPCQIFRDGKIYLGVIGRPGEKLPECLGILSKQLASHTR